IKASAKIVADKKTWRDIQANMVSQLDEVNLSPEQKDLLQQKIQNINFAPQRIVMKRLFDHLGLEVSDFELQVWKNRNRAAHGREVDPDGYERLIRENKVLQVLVNRLLLAISKGAGEYYDIYTIGHPVKQLREPVPGDPNY